MARHRRHLRHRGLLARRRRRARRPLKDHPELLAALLASRAAPLLLLIACQPVWPGELRPARAAALLNVTIVAPLLLHAAASDQLLPVLHSAACLATALPARSRCSSRADARQTLAPRCGPRWRLIWSPPRSA